jgi:hypothetical protein
VLIQNFTLMQPFQRKFKIPTIHNKAPVQLISSARNKVHSLPNPLPSSLPKALPSLKPSFTSSTTGRCLGTYKA